MSRRADGRISGFQRPPWSWCPNAKKKRFHGWIAPKELIWNVGSWGEERRILAGIAKTLAEIARQQVVSLAWATKVMK